jgi:PmbA protein
LLLSPLLTGLSAARVRKAQSPFGDKVGASIAATGLTVYEEGLGLPGMTACPFDRDGAARTRRPLVKAGVLQGLLYSQYEACAADTTSTGSALGGASRAPYVGVAACSVAPGSIPLAELESAQRCVIVPRFAGSTDHVTGDFSGVVKGGYLVEDGQRRPIHETTIAGNVYECLRAITGISRERETLYGQSLFPSLRISDVSITAG